MSASNHTHRVVTLVAFAGMVLVSGTACQRNQSQDGDPLAPLSCTGDADCASGESCQAGQCVAEEPVGCESDADCAQMPGMHVCNTSTGQCYCLEEEDAVCDDDDPCTLDHFDSSPEVCNCVREVIVCPEGQACNPQTGACDAGSTAALQNDFTAAKDAADRLVQALNGGAALEEAVQSATSSLQQDPRVVSAAVGEDGQTVWVKYSSGLAHVLWLTQEDSGESLDDTLDSTAAPPVANRLISASGSAMNAGRRHERASVPIFSFNLPGNNRAVVARGYPNTGSQPRRTLDTVKQMLEDRGYQVDGPYDASLEFFKNTPLNRYGVIYIEADGGVGQDVPVVTHPDVPSTGCDTQNAGIECILTSTPVTGFNPWDSDLLRCNGLLTISPITLRPVAPTITEEGFEATREQEVYAIGTNFVRWYQSGDFPDHTLICLPCAHIKGEGYGPFSAWATLLKSGSVVGWQGGRVPWAVGARAGLNLMQLATGSNKSVEGDVYPGPSFLEKLVPPCMPQLLVDCLCLPDEIKPPWGFGLTRFGKHRLRSGQYARFAGSFKGELTDLLAPSTWPLAMGWDGKAMMPVEPVLMSGFMLTVGDCQRTIDLSSLDLLDRFIFELDPKCSGPVVVKLADGRKSPPRNLLKWSFLFELEGEILLGSSENQPGIRWSAEVSFSVRAMPGSYPDARTGGTTNRAGGGVWQRPVFMPLIGPIEDMAVVWKVWGSAVDDFGVLMQAQGEGMGSTRGALDVCDVGHVDFTDETSARVTCYPGSRCVGDDDRWLTYTVIFQGGSGEPPSEEEWQLPMPDFDLAVDVGPGLTVVSGARNIGIDEYTSFNVKWHSAAPSPAFNADTEPR